MLCVDKWFDARAFHRRSCPLCKAEVLSPEAMRALAPTAAARPSSRRARAAARRAGTPALAHLDARLLVAALRASEASESESRGVAPADVSGGEDREDPLSEGGR